MKYLLQLSIIGLITFVSEMLSIFIPISIPAGIYGLIILFLCLLFKVIKLEWVENTAEFLLTVMPVMFVPSIVNLIETWTLVKSYAAGIVITSVASTIIVMIVSGLVTQSIVRIKNKNSEE